MRPSALLAAALFCTPALSADYSFTGSFSHDDDIRFVEFTVGGLSWVTFRSLSYAGGINATGAAIPRGGFDPVVTVFAADGALLSGGDDGLGADEDPLTHRRFDAMYRLLLASGDYRAAITQYDNTAFGPRLEDGFKRAGTGDYTPTMTYCEADRFCDVSGVDPYNRRDGHWALDVLGVAGAVLAPAPVPVPETHVWLMLGLGLPCLALARAARGRPRGVRLG